MPRMPLFGMSRGMRAAFVSFLSALPRFQHHEGLY